MIVPIGIILYLYVENLIETDTLLRREKEWNKTSTKLNEIKRTIIPWTFPPPPNTPRKYESAHVVGFSSLSSNTFFPNV